MKKLNKIAIIVYFCFIIFEIVGFTIFGMVDNFFFSDFLEFIMNLLTILIAPFWFLFPFYAIVLFTNIGKIYGKSELSKINFNKEKDYYREIIHNYSLIELSYIDNYRIDYKKDLVATLLSLKLKKKIDINENGIEIIDKTIDSLKKSEIYVLEHIEYNHLLINETKLKEIVVAEALEDKVIRKEVFNDYFKRVISIILFIVIMYLLYKYKEVYAFNSIFDLLYAIVEFFGKYILICSIAFLIGFLISKKNSYIRTSKGEEINKKLEGLKLFLKDFSNLSDKEKESLMLWEDYLIYSVLFNINKKIIDDIGKHIIINK